MSIPWWQPRPDQRPVSAPPGLGAGFRGGVFRRLVIVPSPGGGLFIYSPSEGTGNLIGSWTAAAGTDQFGNSYPAGINVTAGVLSGVTLNSLSETMNQGPFILDAVSGLTIVGFTTPGSNNWTAPAGVTSVQAFCWGAGAGGDGGDAGGGEAGGGGGAFAVIGNIAVTPATVYHPFVGTGGAHNTAGTASSFAGDTLTVTANGAPAPADPPTFPNGGAASPTPAGVVSFAGGSGQGGAGVPGGGGGGGSAASNTQAGNSGQLASGTTPGLGGATTSGAFGQTGGAGGNGGAVNGNGANGVAPGGGGGGGGSGGATAGGTGANGQVVLIYSTGTLHTNIVLSATPGTDPATGFNYNAGISSIDPTFGDEVTFFGANITIGASSVWSLNGASLDVTSVGSGLRVAEGANAKQGTATLAAGTVVVANTSVTANSRIFLTAQTSGAGAGALRVSARTAGTSFTITSTNAADTSLVAYEIFEPG